LQKCESIAKRVGNQQPKTVEDDEVRIKVELDDSPLDEEDETFQFEANTNIPEENDSEDDTNFVATSKSDHDDDESEIEGNSDSDISSAASLLIHETTSESECSIETDSEEEQLIEPPTPPQKRRSPRKAKPLKKFRPRNNSLIKLNLFACEANGCRLHFQSIKELNTHLKTHSTTIHQCSECPRTFLQPEMLKLHKMVHTIKLVGRNYLCPFPSCRKTCETVFRAQHHYNIQHGLGLGCFKCHKCELNLASADSLKRHLKRHNKAKDPTLPINEVEHVLAPSPCSVCQLQFLRYRFLDDHRKEVHNLGVECPTCKKILSNRGAFLRHTYQIHRVNPEGYKCQYCPRKFTAKDYLNEHVVIAHPTLLNREGKLECQYCQTKFYRSYILKRHLNCCEKNPELETNLQSEKRDDFICDVCGQHFFNPRTLKAHARRHVTSSGVTSADRVKTRRKITRKIKAASGKLGRKRKKTLEPRERKRKRSSTTPFPAKKKEPVVCEICGESFQLRNFLTRHLHNVHNVPKPKPEQTYICDICGKIFAERGNLNKHQVVHTGERKFVCHLCPETQTFTANSALKGHLVKVHGKKKGEEFTVGEGNFRKKLKCKFPLCMKDFDSELELQIHVGQDHQGDNSRFICKLCGKVFKNQQRLTRHNEVHFPTKPYSCPICQKSFSQPNAVKGHLEGIHGQGKKQEWFPCTQPNCEAKFKILIYLHKHLREKHGVYTGKPRKVRVAENDGGGSI
ncbi:putative zinc finger protein, partial [Orchesella cincta]